MKKIFYPQNNNNNRPYFWHPLSVTLFVLAVVFISGFILFKNTDTNKDTLLGDIKSGVVIAFTNDERKDVGLPDLIESETLNQAALLKAQDMASKSYFAHYSPDGTSPWAWFTKAGYEYKKAGENLAVNFKDSKTVVNAWMDSPTHKANIVKDGYTEIGIGIAEGEYKGKKAMFVVQLFATPKEETKTSNMLAFSIEKKPDTTSTDQTSVRGAEVTVLSLATIFEVFTSQTYSLVIVLLLISLIILAAILILLFKGKHHTKQYYVSLFILIVALGISASTLINFFKDISITF